MHIVVEVHKQKFESIRECLFKGYPIASAFVIKITNFSFKLNIRTRKNPVFLSTPQSRRTFKRRNVSLFAEMGKYKSKIPKVKTGESGKRNEADILLPKINPFQGSTIWMRRSKFYTLRTSVAMRLKCKKNAEPYLNTLLGNLNRRPKNLRTPINVWPASKRK